MPDYKQSAVAGTRWNRATRVIIDNKYGVIPTIDFVEELAMSDGEDVLVKPLGRLSMNFNPDGVIDLINPDTGESLGVSMTQAQIYVALHSLYLKLALDRDAANA